MKIEVELSEAPVMVPRAPKEMISVRRLADGRQYVKINSSSVGVIQECQRKAQYLLHEKYVSENESPATLFGSAIHKALEVFYAGDPRERKLPSLEQMEMMTYGHVVDGESEDLLLRATRAFITRAKDLVQLPPTDMRSLQNGVWLLRNYYETYLNDSYVALVDEWGPFTEREFIFRLHADTEMVIDYFGTIDLGVRDTQSGEILICDHKTTSMIAGYKGGPTYFERDRPNHQYTGYLLGARTSYSLKTDKFLVNVIEVKAKPKTTRGQLPSLPRQITSRDENDFEEFREMVVDVTGTYLRNIERKLWPLGPISSCTSYGACSYKQVCGAPKVLRPNILAAKFKQTGSLM